MEEFRKARGNAYRMAYWILIRKLSAEDFREVLDELKLACEIEEMTEDEIHKILDETTNSYLTRKYY